MRGRSISWSWILVVTALIFSAPPQAQAEQAVQPPADKEIQAAERETLDGVRKLLDAYAYLESVGLAKDPVIFRALIDEMSSQFARLFFIGLSGPSTPGDQPIARIGDVFLYQSDFERELADQPFNIRRRYNTLPRKKHLLDRMVQNHLMLQRALGLGLYLDPEVMEHTRQMLIQRLMQHAFEASIKREDVTEAEMKEYYEAHEEDFNRPEQVRASHIHVRVKDWDDETLVREARQKMQRINREVRSECKQNLKECFSQLASQHSEDARNKYRGGDLGYFARTSEGGAMPQALSEAAFVLTEIYKYSEPVKTELGYSIVQLTGKREAFRRSYEQMRTQILERLFRNLRSRARESYLENLNKETPVEIYDEPLDKINLDQPQPGEATQ
jgi:peptidyl-prolyl cis-trans isomerase C